MQGFRVGAAALALMLSAACTSGAAGSLASHENGPATTGTLSRSDRPVDSGGRGVLQATDILEARAAAASTVVLSVRPVNASRKLAAGYHVRQTYVTSRGGVPGGCWAGSTVARAAYRCFTTNNLVIDPCWAEGSPARSVLCMGSPWSTDITRLRLSGHLDPLPRPRGHVEPWGLRLANGWACVAGQGTHDQLNGRVVFYNCDGWRSGRVVLLGLDRSRPRWLAQTAVRSPRGAYRMGPNVAVVTAWHARP